MAIRRRTALAIGVVGGLAAAAGVLVVRTRRTAPDANDPEVLARDFADTRALAQQDYVDGRVAVWDGWVISLTEAASIPRPPA